MYVNLLPTNLRLRSLLRRRLRQWSLVVIAGAVVLAAAGLSHNARLDRRARDAETLMQRCNSLRELQTELIELESQRSSLQPPQLVTFARNRQQLPEAILAVVAGSVRQAEGLQLRQCSLQDRRPLGAQMVTAKSETGSNPGASTVDVTLYGVADDEHAIARFMQSLREHRAMTTVDLKSVSESNVAGTSCKEFQIHLEVLE
jgi:hypothetical protein